jgi:hypothetical protein
MKKKIIKARLNGDEHLAKILEVEEKVEGVDGQVSDIKDKVAQYNKAISSDIEKISQKTDENAEKIEEKISEVKKAQDEFEMPDSFEVSNAKDIAEELNKGLQIILDSQAKFLSVEMIKSYADVVKQLEKLATKENKIVIEKQNEDVVVNFPTKATNPIAVRLSDGKRFYNALSSGLAQSNSGVITAVGEVTTALADKATEATMLRIEDLIESGGGFEVIRYAKPTGYVVSPGSTISGTITNAENHDDTYLVLGEALTGLTVDFTFNVGDVLINELVFHGRYNGNPAHYMDFEAWDYAVNDWVHISETGDDLPSADTDSEIRINIGSNPNFIKADGEVKIRVIHNVIAYSTAHRL